MRRQVRRFALQRDEDFSGVSGVGIVAYGVQFWDGAAVLHWDSNHTSTALYNSVEELEAIHGHEGRTKLVWIDQA